MGEPALSLGLWWEKPAANDGCVSDREYYNYFRYYDPSNGRYITSDPIGILRDYSNPLLKIAIDTGVLEETGFAGEGLNHLYGYVGQNPLYWFDPLGLAYSPQGEHGSSREEANRLPPGPTVGDAISDPNGNVFPGFTPQDGVCSSIACILNPFPPMLERCKKHDQCFTENACNQSSFISNALGGTKSCNQCNSNF